MIKQLKVRDRADRQLKHRALLFWTEKMGLQVVTDQPMGPGMRWIELKIPGAQTGIALFTPPGDEAKVGSFSGMSFATDNVEKTYAELSARGVEFEQAPKREDWGTSAIFKKTSIGNQVRPQLVTLSLTLTERART